ncbi:MAG: ABC transporter ATP-binding protein [Clostridiales bacterium]|jgi:putative ABC transport system ATP-binding protein|nr:ABC transporter ATP-binding protein [Clostridiales bacterium]
MFSVVLDLVSKKYINGSTDLIILDKASYNFEFGKFYSIVGRSGLGKTTLVSLIGTVEKADEGSILVSNHNLSDVSMHKLTEIRRKDIGFVFQNFSLIDRYSIIDNLEIPLYFSGIRKESHRLSIIKKCIESVGISENQLEKKVSQLSGGEKQRIAICRALLNSPSIIIADEPTGNLDEDNEQNIVKAFMDIKASRNCTIIMVTHNKSIANKADVMITLEDGKIVEVGGTI